MTSSYELATTAVKNYLLDYPIDKYDESSGDYYTVNDWESFETRDFSDSIDEEDIEVAESLGISANTRKIGSINMMASYELIGKMCMSILGSQLDDVKQDDMNKSVVSIFNKVLTQLEKDKIIRKIPEVKRQQFKLVEKE